MQTHHDVLSLLLHPCFHRRNTTHRMSFGRLTLQDRPSGRRRLRAANRVTADRPWPRSLEPIDYPLVIGPKQVCMHGGGLRPPCPACLSARFRLSGFRRTMLLPYVLSPVLRKPPFGGDPGLRGRTPFRKRGYVGIPPLAGYPVYPDGATPPSLCAPERTLGHV